MGSRIRSLGGAVLVVGAAGCASLAGLSGGEDGGAADAHLPKDVTLQDAGRDVSIHVPPKEADSTDAAHPMDARVVDARLDGGCTHAAPIPPPAAVSPGNKDVSFVVALRSFTSGFGASQSDAGAATGFDLDKTCTCPGPPSCNSPSVTCDLEPGGHDIAGNAFGEFIEEGLSAMTDGDLNARLAAGRFTILFLVSNYNGGPNDEQVYVAVFGSSGTGGVTPTWDGTDRWQVDPATVVGTSEDAGAYSYVPLYETGEAYVNDYTLVADLPPLSLGLDIGVFDYSGVILSAAITTDAGVYSFGGEMAARVSVEGILTALGGLVYTNSDGGTNSLCGQDPLYLSFRDTVCGQSDIMIDSAQDNTDAGCNALSFAFGFTGAPAQLGPPVAPAYPKAGCDGSVNGCM